MQYLLSNIKINGNERFKMKVPAAIVESGYLMKLYIRTHAFNKCEITYDLVECKEFEPAKDGNKHIFRQTTQPIVHQPHNIDIIDFMASEELIEIDCLPFPKTGMIIHIDQTSAAYKEDGLEPTIYDALLEHLDVDFAYEY